MLLASQKVAASQAQGIGRRGKRAAGHYKSSPSSRKQAVGKVVLQGHEQGIPNQALLACNCLANVDKPTGSLEIPYLVQRVSKIKREIDTSEVIGYVKLNDTEDDNKDKKDNELEGSRGSLKGTNWADGIGNLHWTSDRKRWSV